MKSMSQLIHPHKLLALAKVVEHRNITMAAKDLHMTQPAVTNIIRQLESHFGQRLVQSEGKRMLITDAGQQLATYWLQLAHLYEDMHQTMSAHEQGDRGKIRIHMVSTGKYFMPKVINPFLTTYPLAEFDCHVVNREALFAALHENKTDLAIATNPEYHPQLETTELHQNHLIFVINPKHRLAGNQQVSFADIQNLSFITREKTALITQSLFQYFAEHDAKPQVAYEIDSTEAIKEAIMVSHEYIALLPMDSVRRPIQQHYLQPVSLTHAKPMHTHHWHVIWHTQHPLNAISQRFLAAIQSTLHP